ncbi:acetate--CoA ligase family protein [Deferrisoma sp.]
MAVRGEVLDETAARALLEGAGVPLVPQREVGSADEAVAAARELGFPAVVKGLGAAHKTEEGLVRLGLADEAAVRRAAEDLLARVPTLAVQPQVAGRREFLLGAYRDERFGPVVVFGLGGVLTEALGDVALRVAPVGEAEALAMVGELRSRKLLGSFRGEAAVDREALARAVAGLSRLVAERPEIAEVDLNPLIARADGSVVAVDALVVRGEPKAGGAPRPPVDTGALARIFHPRSVAVVGASAGFGKWGNAILTNLLAGGYEGRVYPVNPRGGTLCGLPVLRSVDELPDGVDLAIVTVPADKVGPAVEALARRGVRHAVIVSSGFREAGGDGPEREVRLVARARELGLTLIGPNTMGIVNPHARLYATGAHVRPGPGGTTLVSQSGNLGVQLLSFARAQGLGIRAFCGTGNEAMTGVEDFLEALECDDASEVVALYLEDIRDGRRFFEACRRVSRRKPVVVLKGGRTGAGQRAAASHTGALAGDTKVFEAACRQAGAVWVTQPGDLLDVSAAFSAVPLPRGNRVAVVTWGGGWGVVTADLCAEEGLELPDLSPGSLAALDALLPPYWSRGNPVDLVGEPDPQLPRKALEILLADPGIDAVIHLGLLGRGAVVGAMLESSRAADPDRDEGFLAQVERMIGAFDAGLLRASAELMDRFGKPVVGVSLVPDPEARTLVPVAGTDRRALVFPAPERAVRTLARLAEYAARRETP